MRLIHLRRNSFFNKRYILPLFMAIVIISCHHNSNEKSKHVWIDFFDSTSADNYRKAGEDSSQNIKVAIASIISPQETFIQYNNILNYIESKLNKKLVLVQKKTYREVNSLLKRNEIDLAFICSGAYVSGYADSAFSLLVIPERHKQHYYQAYIVVHKDSDIKSFSDFRNKKFIFSDSLSNTGMFYPLKRLSELNTTSGDFFAETYFSNAHDYSIEMVSRKIVDGASVNGLIYDYSMIFNPEKIKNTKIIEKSELFGMPPIVVSKGIDENLKKELFLIFTEMHNDSVGSKILKSLLIDKYVAESDTIYKSIRVMCSKIDQMQ